MSGENILIRKMTEADIAFVARIEEECFSLPWTQEGLRSELTNEQAHFYVLECDGAVAAYMGMHIVLDECYIANVAVSSASRRKGFGVRLVENAVSVAADNNCVFITLEVRKSNESAISLYGKCGFEILGERKDFYSRPTENALIMTKKFSIDNEMKVKGNEDFSN